jgi:beta-fructofuranosidase
MKHQVVIIQWIIIVLFGSYTSYGQADKPPYISAVTKYNFSKTLVGQEEELKANPMVKRFADSREKLSSDRYRPIYHFSGPEGRIGDPNGLCFWQGNWHLFYQAFPAEDRRQHWGHAVSTDLIHWKDLPYAIYPGPERQVYSGSTLVEENRVIAMYHGTALGNMIALSDDPLLLNWEKVTGNAVIPTKSATGFPLPYSVFDPCIWNRDSVYYALSAGKITAPGGMPAGAAYLFRSKDLKKWEYMHQFVEGDRFSMVGDDFACPYFWPIGDRYIMYFFSHMSGGQFLLGDYDTKDNKFRVTSGSGHAGIGPPSATPDGKGGVIVVASIAGGYTIPRRVTLIGPDEVGQEPVTDISSLRYDAKHIEKLKLPGSQEIVLKGISGNAMEISAEIDMKNSQMVEMNILRSPKKEEYTRIYKAKGYNGKGLSYISAPETALMPADLVPLFTDGRLSLPQPPRAPGSSLISIETTFSSSLPDANINAPLTLPFFLNPGETVKLRIFIDKSVVEVFVNGKQVLAASMRPGRDDSKGVSIRSQGQEAELISLDAWQMKSIF